MPLGHGDDRFRRIALGEASAVGTFMTSTASLASSSSKCARARRRSVASSASPAMSTGLARDQIGGSAASSFFMVAGEMSASSPPKSDQTIDRQHADAAAIGQDRQPLAGNARQMRRAFRRRRTTRRDRARAAVRRGGTRRHRPRPIRQARRYGSSPLWRLARDVRDLIDQHRLGAGGGARRRHEFARVLDQFDIEQDRPRRPVHGEIIEQVGKIDVDAVANRRRQRKSRCRAPPPIPRGPSRWRRIARSAQGRPARGIDAAKLALSLTPGTSTPRQLGPTRRMPGGARGFFRMCRRASRGHGRDPR